MSLAKVYFKTDAGIEEMQRRQAGLNPRVRQLLILVDGKRSVGELGRMMAVAELEEFLALLELKGLIASPQDLDTPHPSPSVVKEQNPGLAQESFQVSARPPGALSDSHSSTSVLESTASRVSTAQTPLGQGDRAMIADDVEKFHLDRRRMAKLLGDTVGPMGDDLGVRIEKAKTSAELAQLFVASLTVVELMAGRKAADRFVEKMKQMGWEAK
jgi:hypothetical protein